MVSHLELTRGEIWQQGALESGEALYGLTCRLTEQRMHFIAAVKFHPGNGAHRIVAPVIALYDLHIGIGEDFHGFTQGNSAFFGTLFQREQSGFANLVEVLLDKIIHRRNQAQLAAEVIVQRGVILVPRLAVDHSQRHRIYPVLCEQMDSCENQLILGVFGRGEIGLHENWLLKLSHRR